MIFVEQQHKFSLEEAKRRTTALEPDFQNYGLKIKWDNFSAKISGAAATGEVFIMADRVVIAVKLGFLAKAAGIKEEALVFSLKNSLERVFKAEPAALVPSAEK